MPQTDTVAPTRTAGAQTAGPPRQVLIAGRPYEVVRPRLEDPRFHLASVIISLHVLGQTMLGFDISILQILVAVGTAGTIGFVVALVQDHRIAWPASAVLAGNGVAFILRVPGTRHGDWWSSRGWTIFAATAALAVCSKYVIRWKGRHVFNPSNLALVAAFLILGSSRADPLAFWWGPMSTGTFTALSVILVGGVAILVRLRVGLIAISFWSAFATSIGLVSATGHCMAAPWSFAPVCGRSFWWVLVTSPEVLVFMFFMITDPKTSPAGRVRRVVYGIGIGVVAGMLSAPQSTEFATKVAILSALLIVCAARPFYERRLPAKGSVNDRPIDYVRGRALPRRQGVVRTLGTVATMLIVGFVLVAVAPNSVEPTVRAKQTVADAVERPTFAADEFDEVEVTVNQSDRVALTLTPATVDAIGRDVLEDLAIIEQAQRGGSVQLLATATAESTLEALERDLISGLRAESVEVSSYRISTLVISIARRVGQGPPAILVTLVGAEEISGDRPRTRRVHDTYEVKRGNSHFLLVTDDLPPGFDPPG